jgi:hypothetical protein
MNNIELDGIKHRAYHNESTDKDCLDLIQHIEILTGDIACEGSLLEKIADNLSDYIDVDFDVSIDKSALKRLIQRNK